MAILAIPLLAWILFFKFKTGGIFMFKKIRAGCKDMNNAFMVRGAKFSENDIPICLTTAKIIP